MQASTKAAVMPAEEEDDITEEKTEYIIEGSMMVKRAEQIGITSHHHACSNFTLMDWDVW